MTSPTITTPTRPAPGCDAGRREGERRRDCALAVLANRREVYIRRARRAFLERCLSVGQATADDVREVVELPPGIDPNLFGAVPSLFARLGIVWLSGFDVSRRPARHAGLNRVWQLRDAGAAREWLAKNPDITDAVDDHPDQDQDGPQRLLFSHGTNEPTPTAATIGADPESF